MQTTLLGLAIAVILALLTALIGPYFVDWNQFRPQFEAEASRIIGAPVHVRDDLEARLLPTPTLRLRAVTIGRDADASRVRVARLDVEFSLGALMRGEWRANELTLDGFALDLGLDDHGRIAWPASQSSNLGTLAIDRLHLNGRVVLHDAISHDSVALEDIVFAGDVRALAGAARGEGEFRFGEARYPFRLSSSRSADGAGSHVHLSIDPGERPIGVDLEGQLGFDAMAPRFDGTVALSRAITLRGGNRTTGVTTPWKLSAKLKADPSAARFDQLEAVYGSDEVGLKLSGSADISLGASPALHATLSAHQLDADRLLARETTITDPTRLIPGLRDLVAALPSPPFVTRIALGADTVTLGGRPIQNIAAEVHSDGADWVVDRLDARLPGATQLSLAGRLLPQPTARFAGYLTAEASDPGLLSAWLRGGGESAVHPQKPLRLTGALSIGADRIALDDVDAEIEGAAVTGRLALTTLGAAPAGRSSASAAAVRFEAALNADRLDLDGLVGLARAFAGPRDSWPDEAQIALDVGHGRLGGRDLAPVIARASYGATAITLNSLIIGAADAVKIEGNGALDRVGNSGRIVVSATAAALPPLVALVAPLLPDTLAARLGALPSAAADGGVKAKVSFSLDGASQPDRVNAIATAEIDAPHLKATLHASAAPTAAVLHDLDPDALAGGEISLDLKLAADRGATLTSLLGIDRVVAAGDGAAQLEGSARGVWRGPMRFKVSATGSGLDAEAQGTFTAPTIMAFAVPSPTAAAGEGGAKPAAADAQKGTDPGATIALTARKLDVAPLLDTAPGRLPSIAVSSRIGVAGSQLTFDDIDATLSGMRLRGHLAVTRGDAPAFSGELGMDRLDLGPAFALAIGAIGRGSGDPLGRPLWLGASGAIALQAPRGVLPGGIEVKPLQGTVRGDGGSLSFDAKGALGGGEAAAEVTARPGPDGLAIDARAQLSGVDGTALTWRGLAAPSGKTSMQLVVAGRGRSLDAVTGALAGGGTVSLDQVKLNGLDPAAFDAAIAASDASRLNGETALRDMMVSLLRAGPLTVASAQIPFSVRDGSLRVAPTTLDGDGARVVVSGGYDILADQLDLRADMTSTRFASGAEHPEIEIFAHGPPDRLNRTVDVALLSSWLAVRAIDRETRRLDALERGERNVPASSGPGVADAPAAPADAAPADASPLPSAPRRAVPRPKAVAPPAPQQPPPQASAASGGLAPPLPPPIEVRPPPGAARPRPRPPLALTPVPN